MAVFTSSPLGIQLWKVVWCKALCVVHINCFGDPALLVHLQGGGHILHGTAHGSRGLLSAACHRHTQPTVEGGLSLLAAQLSARLSGFLCWTCELTQLSGCKVKVMAQSNEVSNAVLLKTTQGSL